MEEYDKKILTVMKAIRNIESGGAKDPYNIIGDGGRARGAFQWDSGGPNLKKGEIPKNWRRDALETTGDANIPMTKANQNKIAYLKLSKWKAQGGGPEELAARWNGAKKNKLTGVHEYVNPEYGVKFRNELVKLKQESSVSENVPQNVPQEPEPTTDNTYNFLEDITGQNSQEDLRQERINQGFPVGTDGRAEPTLAGELFRGVARPVIQGAQQILNLPSMLSGGAIPENTFTSDIFGDVPSFSQAIERRAKKESDAYLAGEQGLGKTLLKTTGEAAVQAVNAANLIPAFEVGSQAISRIAGSNIPKLAKAGLQSLVRGGGQAGIADVSQQIADKGSVDIRETIPNVIAGSVLDFGLTKVLPETLKFGKSVYKNIVTPAEEKIVQGRTKVINEVVDSYASLKKYRDYAKESKGFDPVDFLSRESDIIQGSVNKEGTITTRGENGAIAKFNNFIEPQESIVTDILKAERSTVKADILHTELKKAINKNRTLTIISRKSLLKEAKSIFNEFKRVYKSEDIPLHEIQSEKIATYKNIDYTNPDSKLGAKLKANVYKTIIENNAQFKNIKKVNGELSKLYTVREFLEKLDGKKVKGGRLGKYFARTMGAVVGSNFGPLGGIVGSELAGMGQGKILSSNLKAKLNKNLKYSDEILRANSLRKTGDVKFLPEGKKGVPQAQNFVPERKLGPLTIEPQAKKIRMSQSEYNQSKIEKVLNETDSIKFNKQADKESFVKFAQENLPAKKEYTEAQLQNMYQKYSRQEAKKNLINKTKIKLSEEDYAKINQDDLTTVSYGDKITLEENLEKHGNRKYLNQLVNTKKRLKEMEYLDMNHTPKSKNGNYIYKGGLQEIQNRKRAKLIDYLNNSREGMPFIDAEDGSSINKAIDAYKKDKETLNNFKEATKNVKIETKKLLKQKRIISQELYQKALSNFKNNSERLNTGIPIDQIKDIGIIAAYHIENGVRNAVELGKVLAEKGYKLTKAQLDKLYKNTKTSNNFLKNVSRAQYISNQAKTSEFFDLYNGKSQNIEKAIKLAKELKYKMSYSMDYNTSFSKNSIIYFETPFGQISFHDPNLNYIKYKIPKNKIKFDGEKNVSDKIFNEYKKRFNKNFNNKIIDKNLKIQSQKKIYTNSKTQPPYFDFKQKLSNKNFKKIKLQNPLKNLRNNK